MLALRRSILCGRGISARRAFTSASSASDGVLLTDVDENRAIATLTINRPRALNALNTEVVLALKNAYDTLGQDDRVRALVLTGSQKAFAAGAARHDSASEDFSIDGPGILIPAYCFAIP